MSINLIGPIIPDRVTPSRTTTAGKLADLQFRLGQVGRVVSGLRTSRDSYKLSLRGALESGNFSTISSINATITSLDTQISQNIALQASLTNEIENLSKTTIKDQGGATVGTKKKKGGGLSVDPSGWLVTFSDLITLLEAAELARDKGRADLLRHEARAKLPGRRDRKSTRLNSSHAD
jgi:hypothetical protein